LESISYLGSLDRLRAAISSMARHLAPGGILFLEPWLTPPAYREDEVVHNFGRTPERAISWMYVMRRDGRPAVWDIHCSLVLLKMEWTISWNTKSSVSSRRRNALQPCVTSDLTSFIMPVACTVTGRFADGRADLGLRTRRLASPRYCPVDCGRFPVANLEPAGATRR
jgi:hypothetical protein